jgi:hypothetical protein
MLGHLIPPAVIAAACTVPAVTEKPECSSMKLLSLAMLLPFIPAFLSAATEDSVTLLVLDFVAALLQKEQSCPIDWSSPQ